MQKDDDPLFLQNICNEIAFTVCYAKNIILQKENILLWAPPCEQKHGTQMQQCVICLQVNPKYRNTGSTSGQRLEPDARHSSSVQNNKSKCGSSLPGDAGPEGPGSDLLAGSGLRGAGGGLGLHRGRELLREIPRGSSAAWLLWICY